MQFADLTVAGRWPKLLNAIASTNIGILGVDAHWANTEPRFWESLDQFVKGGKSFVYIRRMLDFQNAQSSLSLIRSMPAHWERNIIATTPATIWFAHEAESAARLRQLLRESEIFPESATNPDNDLADSPVIVTGECRHELIDRGGRFPRAVLLTNDKHRSEIEFKSGWSKPEPDGCWSASNESVMRIRLPSTMSGPPTTINISGNGWVAPDKSAQIIEVGLGHEPSQWIETEFRNSTQIKSIAVDCAK